MLSSCSGTVHQGQTPFNDSVITVKPIIKGHFRFKKLKQLFLHIINILSQYGSSYSIGLI